MDVIPLPTEDQLRQRVTACQQELRSLRRLLRVAQDVRDAEEANLLRKALAPQIKAEGASHA